MTDERVTAIRALLGEAEAAHGAYETRDLGGVYDREWAQWYAGYLVDHGIGPVLDREVSAQALGAFLSRSFAAFQQLESAPPDDWAAYVARDLVSEL